jgi:hypothetical protein
MFMAATHNGISRLYETFGNGGTAETVDRTLSPSETARTWFKQDPPLPRVKWSMRDNNNYEETGLLVSLGYFANNRRQFLRNFYEKAKRSIAKPHTEGPAAYVLPATDSRHGAQAELLRVLQKQHVEISRATAPFSVTLPARRAARGGGRGGRGGDADSAATDRGAGAPAADTAATREVRQFPAGSYIVRMDQPYSRIADALLDYQYWSPTDPQKRPYDDTGWTFPEGFAVPAVRVVDARVLDVPMERVSGEVRAKGGVSGSGAVFAINHDGDNALATLRYRFKDADFQAAEEPFEADGVKFNRGSFLIRNIPAADLGKAAAELGVQVHALTAAPTVKTHPLRAARVAIMHTWGGTQTEGWWRQAFDLLHIPYDYISVQDVAKSADLNIKYDVIIFGPGSGGAQGVIDGMPMWRNPMPWRNSPETPNIGTWAQTDDIRPGLGYGGVEHLRDFVKRGGVFIGVNSSADFAIALGMTNGVSGNQARSKVVGSLLRTKLVDDRSPIGYGVPDNLAVYSEDGESFGVSSSRGGRGGGGGGGNGASRATGRGTPDDPDVVQGRLALEPRFEAPVRPTVQPWQLAPITDDQLRNPLNVIPPDQRPRVILRFSDQRELLVSGLLDGGGEIAQRPVVVDSPMEKGHVVLFANNPIYRGETIGSYFLVFNTLLNFDHLDAGRKLDAR